VKINPISKIVNVLKKMQTEIKAEGDKDEDLYEKYYCYCKNGAAQLAKDMQETSELAKRLTADIEAGKARKAQLDQEVEDARQRRKEAKEAMDAATAIRKKEREEFEKQWADCEENQDALTRAIKAIRQGMGQSFLQSSVNRERLLHAVQVGNGLMEVEKEEVLSFLSQNPFGDYSGQSGEIVGYLEQMFERMQGDCAALKKAEEEAQKSYDELMAAKQEEIKLATAEIEEKIEKAGKVAVETAQKQGQLQESGRSLEADRGFLADLEKNCADQKKEYEARQKERNEELAAVSEAIKILNDDDARDIFKSTLPADRAVAASFIQREESPQQQALELVEAASQASQAHRPRLSLLAYMLKTGKVDFSKVIKMIEDMRQLLKKEQKDDDNSLQYCESELKTAADNVAEFERSIKQIQANIEALANRMDELKQSIEDLGARIKETNKMMEEATAQRKQENEQYVEDLATAQASIQIMEKARNILNKIYNKAAYTTKAPRQLSEDEQILVNSGGTLQTEAPEYIRGTKILALQKKPAPPPEVGTYKKKQNQGTGVTQLITNMINDVDKQINQMKMEEEEAQKDYEELMAKSEAAVKADTEAKTQAEQSLAQATTDKNQAEQDLASTKDELAKEHETIQALHADCDFLMNNYETRKSARAEEDDSLSRAVSILQGATGADYGNEPPAAAEE